jgi:hypothetical protein
VSALLIPDPAINRFAPVATTEDTTVNDRGQVVPTPTHGSSKVESADYEESKAFMIPTKEDKQRTSESSVAQAVAGSLHK